MHIIDKNLLYLIILDDMIVKKEDKKHAVIF